jgi:hypothetical protein
MLHSAFAHRRETPKERRRGATKFQMEAAVIGF